MNAIMRWWYGDLDESFVNLMPKYAAAQCRYPRIRFSYFRGGKPGGGWFIRRNTLTHRAFGMYVYGAFGRLGWHLGLWPVWNIRFEGYLFPPKEGS